MQRSHIFNLFAEECEGGAPAEADKLFPAVEEKVLQAAWPDPLLCQRFQGEDGKVWKDCQLPPRSPGRFREPIFWPPPKRQHTPCLALHRFPDLSNKNKAGGGVGDTEMAMWNGHHRSL